MSTKTALVLGAGSIGGLVAERFVERGMRVVIHSRTQQRAIRTAAGLTGPGRRVESDWGDLYVPRTFREGSGSRSELLDFVYGVATESLLQRSMLYDLLVRWRPEVVVDTATTATALGTAGNPYRWRELLSATDHDQTRFRARVHELLSNDPTPLLVRFVEALDLAFRTLGLRTYVKVSTTGLAGMGFNLRLTHGDPLGPRLSGAILGKVAAAGVLHQLLWALSHTPGTDVKLVVPAALVGWEEIRHGPFDSPGGTAKVSTSAPQRIVLGAPLPLPGVNGNEPVLRMTTVGAGDGKVYSREEAAFMSNPAQFGTVLRSEIAQHVLDVIDGRVPDVLAMMDRATPGPSYAGGLARAVVLDRMRASNDVPSVATGNLGPTVAKHLLELSLLSAAAGGPSAIANGDAAALVRRARELAIGQHPIALQALGLGIAIMLDDELALLPARPIVPSTNEVVTPERLAEWVAVGWVDIRVPAVRVWQKSLASVADPGSSLGDLLAMIYARQGGGRRDAVGP